MDADDPRHGTTNGYGNLGCRCEDCTAAWRAYRQDYRRRLRERFAAGVITPEHGKGTTYSNYRCRCDDCTEAWRVECAERRRRRSELVTREGQ